MKKIITCLYLMLASIMGKSQIAQDETFIRQLDQHNAATLLKRDTAAMKKYLAVDFLINSSSNRISFGGERILSLMRTGQFHYVKFDVLTDTVYFLNRTTAISMGSEMAVYGSEGPLKDQLQKRRYTNIWVMEKKVWKLKARHSSIVCTN